MTHQENSTHNLYSGSPHCGTLGEETNLRVAFTAIAATVDRGKIRKVTLAVACLAIS